MWTHRISYAQDTAAEHTRSNAAVTPYRIVTARAECLLHARTGRTRAAAFQQDFTDIKAPLRQGKQVHARHHEITPQRRRRDGAATAQGGNDGQVFCLNQGDLARSAGTLSVVITFQTEPGEGVCRGYRLHRGARRRPQPNPFQPPCPGQRVP